MIRFFSKMRYKLAAENRTAKYLRYAVGEILLVVIGILIAVQVNNWNEARKDRIQERKFLVRLEAELTTDLKNISTSIAINNDRMQRAEFLMTVADQPHFSEDSSTYFIQSIEYAGYTNFPVISDNTFEEIISSGKLSLIQDEGIRTTLQQYYSWTSDRGQYEFIRQDTQLNYLHKREGILSPGQQISMGHFRNTKPFGKIEANQAYERMIRKTDFLEFIPIVIQGQIRNGESFEEIKLQAIDLKKMIENELTK